MVPRTMRYGAMNQRIHLFVRMSVKKILKNPKNLVIIYYLSFFCSSSRCTDNRQPSERCEEEKQLDVFRYVLHQNVKS